MREFLALVALGAMPVVGCVSGVIGPESDSAEVENGGGTSSRAGTAANLGGRSANAGSPGAGGARPGTGGGSGTVSPGGGSGGQATSAAGSGAVTPIGPEFKLLWKDEFDSFDASRWAKADHTFIENLGRFTPDNAVIEGGLLKLRVTKVPRGDRPYSAAELYSRAEYSFGRYEARIKFCKGSGVVSSLFTYKDDALNQWEEIDIEHLGNLPRSIQYNLISSPAGDGNNRLYQPFVVHFDYRPSEEFHDYAIEWKPEGITFYVDGVYSHKLVQARIQHAARLRMNAWPTNSAETNFAGPLDTNAIPCEAQYEWMAAYAYQP